MTEYVVQFGLAGYVGRFVGPAELPRATAVLIHTLRGTEVGTILNTSGGVATQALAHFAPGPIERVLTAADAATRTELATLAHAAATVAQAQADAQEWGVQVLEAEALWVGPIVLHVLAWHPEPLDAWVQSVAAAIGQPVLLHDVTHAPIPAPEPEPSGCGKPGCGSEGGGSCGTSGGCSTGSCSRGTLKSAAEVREYFAGLREQMEARPTGRVPLA